MNQSDLNNLTQWLADEFAKRKKDTAIVGLSGGIDSAVTFCLCLKANINSMPVLMPYKWTECMSRAVKMVSPLYDQEDISSVVDAYIPPMPAADQKVRIGNFCARVRMAILYDLAKKYCGLVVGTSNKTEIMLGYGTRWGDTACDINPLGNLLKCQVYELAKLLNVPQEIIDAVPSADLWEGQTDEGELGFTYAEADRYFIEGPQHVDPDVAIKILKRIQATEFKRQPIPIWSRK